MKIKCLLDDKVYTDLLKMLNTLHLNERIGTAHDMDFIENGLWLSESVVVENLWLRRGEWEIHLLFAHKKRPLTFLSRHITKHVCPKRAAMVASFMRRLVAKDQRVSGRVGIESFKFPRN